MKCPICIGIDVPKSKLKSHLEYDYKNAFQERVSAGRIMEEVLAVAEKLKIKLDV